MTQLLCLLSLLTFFVHPVNPESCFRAVGPTPSLQCVDQAHDGQNFFSFKTTDVNVCGTQCLRERNCAGVNYHSQPVNVCDLLLESYMSGNASMTKLYPRSEVTHFAEEDLQQLKVVLLMFKHSKVKGFCSNEKQG